VDNLGFNLLSIGQICDNKCRVTFSEHDSEITKDGKVIGRGIRKKGLYVMKLGNKLKDKICLATIDENSTLWHRRLGHANMRLIQSLASNELVRNLPKLKKVEESLNVTFDETPPPFKKSPLVDDDLDEEEAIKVTEKKNLENDIEDETLEIDEIDNIKESRNHPLENELLPQPRNMIIIGTKWVFRNKLDENGIVSRNKARLVAQGYNQQEGIDYDETYAPVSRLESIRILLACACALDFKLFQMDVKSAFLNGFINEEVYVAQPPGFINFEKPNHVYKLKKALYGLKQAPKACFQIMHDDFKMSMMGELNFFLGLQIKQMDDGIFFNQSKYIKEMLKKFGLEDSKPMKTPMSSDTKLTKDEECESVDSTKYRGMIGHHFVYLKLIEEVLSVASVHEGKGDCVLDYYYSTREIIPTLKPLEEIIQENIFCLGGNRDYVPACLCFLLYCAVHSKKFNLAYFMAKRMEWDTKQARLILPYGMLLTRLFKFIMNEYPELQNESYVLYDRVMNPLAAQLKQKPRRDHGTRRGRHSTSSSSAFDQPSSSHLNDDDDDGNDEGTSHASTPSPIRYVNSLTISPLVFKTKLH
ncbi:retrovirus-related pol polyprotein from transposon TNT 1-94, partial [Tanacetum coccineum]